MKILCGWCRHPTDGDADCANCGHEDPARPWIQRGQEPPAVRIDAAGRPTLDRREIRRRLREARTTLGSETTNAAIAEHLGVSARTLGRWQKMAG